MPHKRSASMAQSRTSKTIRANASGCWDFLMPLPSHASLAGLQKCQHDFAVTINYGSHVEDERSKAACSQSSAKKMLGLFFSRKPWMRKGCLIYHSSLYLQNNEKPLHTVKQLYYVFTDKKHNEDHTISDFWSHKKSTHLLME